MKSYTRYVAILAALALLTVVAGCSPFFAAASPGDKTSASLDGTSWTLLDLGGKDLVPGTEITLVVDGDRLSGRAGCNHYFGSVIVRNGAPSVGRVGSTEMWCAAPEGVMEQETDYLQALDAAVRYSVENGELTLFDADGQARLVFVPETAPTDKGNAVDDGDAVGPDTGATNVYLDEIDLLVMESFPVQVAAIVRGNLSDGCVVLDGISAQRTDEGFVIEVDSHREGDFCTQALVPFEERVTLDVLGLAAGTYAVRAGEVSSEFTLAVDNGPVNDEPVGNQPADGASVEYVKDLQGTVTGIEIGADGLQVELTVPLAERGERVYSVTISVMQAEIFGRWEEIQPGAELVVSGPVIAGMDPTLVVAEKVTIVGSDSDYVSNLHGTVMGVERGPEGLRAEIRADDGTDYRVTFDAATTELVYVGEESELQVGTPVLVSGELFRLLEAQFAPRIAADVTVVL
jgi:inhibitor of cysteine peptidase